MLFNFKEKLRGLTQPQFVKFLLVGGLNTLFGYLCFYFFFALGLHYSVALFIATIIAVLFNFKTTGRLVFQSHNNRLIARFVWVYIIVYILNIIGIALFENVGFPPNISGAILLLPMAIVSFLLNRKWVFSHA